MIKTNKKQLVSNIINDKVINTWYDGDVITISAGTGKGKSYFIKNELYKIAKQQNEKILMLIHRSNCVNQFEQEIKNDNKTDVIDIKTYQNLEFKELNLFQNNLKKYKYIVCDEFHYFMCDAGFNKTTDVSFKKIISQEKAIKIFMSATGDIMHRVINRIEKIKTTDYELKTDYSFIKTLTFFNNDETLNSLAEEAIQQNKKHIFFIQSAEKAYKLYKQYSKYAIFNCSKENNKYYKYVDVKKINEMLQNEKFEELLLITTSCLDAGVNIIDDELENIVVDIKDISSLIQCIGRKRIIDNEQINVFVKAINNKQLGGMKTNAKKNIEMADFLQKHNVKEFMEKYPREIDKSNIIYNDYCVADGEVEKDLCTLKINELMLLKKKIDICEYGSMINYGEFGYCKYLADKFGFYDEGVCKYTYQTINENKTLENYLEQIEGKVMLQLKDRKELIEKINLRRNRKLIKKANSINPALLESKINYHIVEFETSKVIDGQKKKFKNAWKVIKI